MSRTGQAPAAPAARGAVTPVRIATRGSDLAMAQANLVLTRCRQAFPTLVFELRILKTTGDRLRTASLARPAAHLPKGLFTKELEAALLEDEADLAVHSLKDLPTAMPDGLRLGGVLEREDPRDVLILRGPGTGERPARRASRPGAGAIRLPELRRAAVVATSSTRRAAQLHALRPDLQLVEIRGNVPTRLRKLATEGAIEATLLAAAGLARLGIRADRHGVLACPPELAASAWERPLVARVLTLDEMLPAVGQAAIGLQCRVGDRRAAAICRRLTDRDTRVCVEAERAFLAAFGGGCQSPVAALGTIRGGRLRLRALAFEGARAWDGEVTGAIAQARSLGGRLGRAACVGVGRGSP